MDEVDLPSAYDMELFLRLMAYEEQLGDKAMDGIRQRLALFNHGPWPNKMPKMARDRESPVLETRERVQLSPALLCGVICAVHMVLQSGLVKKLLGVEHYEHVWQVCGEVGAPSHSCMRSSTIR